MKKKFSCLALLLSLPFAPLGENMKLVHSTTGFVVVEFKTDGKIEFNDRFLKIEMEEQGILIPPVMRDQFGHKEIIYLDDPLFEKAVLICIEMPPQTICTCGYSGEEIYICPVCGAGKDEFLAYE